MPTTIFSKAAKKALGGGLPGAIAMVLQVLLLMWLRTTINYQYRNGGSVYQAFSNLYSQGGIPRFYQGLGPALFQAPLSRFGDTAANEGMKSLLEGRGLSVGFITFCASMAAAFWRIFITPIDTLKTMLQVEGKVGAQILREKVSKYGMFSLYDGWEGTYLATLVGHFPWFFTFNFLDKKLPKTQGRTLKLLRRALIGFCCSATSDCVSNSVRVVKTFVQTSSVPVSYYGAIGMILTKDGLRGLFIRGLGIKLISNGISGMLFTVLWKSIEEMMAERAKRKSW